METKICSRCGKLKPMHRWETMCYSCEKKEHLERQQEAIRSAELGESVDTWSDDYVICPYCGEAWKPDLSYEEYCVEGSHEIQCPNCDKWFNLCTYVSYSWETEKLD